MAKKKDTETESALEKGAEAVLEVADAIDKEVDDSIEDAEDEVKEVIEKVDEEIGLDEKKKASKKTTKKEEKSDAKKLLEEKLKKLEGKFEKEKKVNIKGEVKGEKEEKDTLVPIEDYLKSSIHLGTRVVTPDMKPYVYKRRADGLAVFNTALLDDKIREGAEYLAQFAPEDIVLACKREAGWQAAKLFGETLGIRVFTKKYPAGCLTNPNLDDFFETDLVLICDPWLDKNALNDAKNVKLKVMAICDTNNYTQKIDQIVPGNNKSGKSLGMVLYLLAKLYAEKRKMDVEIPGLDSFIENWADAQIPS